MSPAATLSDIALMQPEPRPANWLVLRPNQQVVKDGGAKPGTKILLTGRGRF